MSLPRSDAVRPGDDLRSGIVKLARDPLLRRPVCATGQRLLAVVPGRCSTSVLLRHEAPH